MVFDVLGSLRLELAKNMGLLDKERFEFVWITEFPLLEYSEEEGRYMAMHHPFTMPMEEDLPMIDTDPGAVRAKAYDIVLNGCEIGGGSVRIHQEEIQEKMFEVLGFTKERAHEQFGFLLDAFQYGVPPHAGLAYGLDRLVMLMTRRMRNRFRCCLSRWYRLHCWNYCCRQPAPAPGSERRMLLRLFLLLFS